MKVVEVIAGLKTDADTYLGLSEYARQMGHKPGAATAPWFCRPAAAGVWRAPCHAHCPANCLWAPSASATNGFMYRVW